MSDLSLRSQEAQFDYLTLVAEPQLLGKLRAHASKEIERKTRGSLAKDLANIPDTEMSQHLSEVLFTREPIAQGGVRA
jgi:protein required for attachment to host cells